MKITIKIDPSSDFSTWSRCYQDWYIDMIFNTRFFFIESNKLVEFKENMADRSYTYVLNCDKSDVEILAVERGLKFEPTVITPFFRQLLKYCL